MFWTIFTFSMSSSASFFIINEIRFLFKNKNWGPTPFRFKNMWLQHKDFDSTVEYWWKNTRSQGCPGHALITKLKGLKAMLKKWNKVTFGNVQTLKNLIISETTLFDNMEHTLVVAEKDAQVPTLRGCGKRGDPMETKLQG